MQEAPLQPEKTKSPFSKFLIFFLLIALLVSLGFGFYQFNQVQKLSQLVDTPTPTPTLNLSPTPSPDPTADWLIYKNEKYRYSFKYPREGELIELGESTGEPLETWQSVGLRIESLEIEVLGYENKSNLSSEEYAKVNSPSLPLSNERPTTVNGNQAFQYDYVEVRGDNKFPVRRTTIAYNGNVIEVVGINLSGQIEFGDYNLLLSTLEFTKKESCQKTGSQKEMSLSKAKGIALASSCLLEGSLTEESSCNQVTGTWWVGMEADREGCNPACVVDVVGEQAEINWRCTGLLAPEATPTFCATCGD